MSERKEKVGIVMKAARFIVDKRKGFFLFFILAAIFCIFGMQWTLVNNDITSYLPETTETKRGLSLMNEQFVTYGSANIMVDNVTYDTAEQLAERMREVAGVSEAVIDQTDAHYRDGAAMISVTFQGEAEDEIAKNAMNELKSLLEPYDTYISSEVGSNQADSIAAEMQTVVAIVLVIIIAVLLFTSKTYMEVPVMLMTFGMAALLNMGTNFLLGEISFVSNSIAVVLQLALAIDYAIILCNRYTEERAVHDARMAVIIALSKAIPEISSSCLTTVSGLVAMMFMQFQLGLDLGVVLIKAIFFSILSVFILMPGLLMSFSGLIDRTHHRNFVPNITGVGKMDVKTRFVVPPVFAVVLIAAFLFSNHCNYVYDYASGSTYKKNEAQIADEKIRKNFSVDNLVVLIVPSGDYVSEQKLLLELAADPAVNSTQGLANTEAMDGYYLTDALTPRQFAELIDMDVEVISMLYSAYAVDQEDYGKLMGNISSYGVPLIDMFDYVYKQKQAGVIKLDGEMDDMVEELNEKLVDAKLQLKTDEYSRLLVRTNLPMEGEQTFQKLEEFHEIMYKYYPADNSFIVGDSTSDMDLSSSFADDNLMISILSALFVLVILVFTFKSAGLPVLLMAIIEGAIWINFSVPAIQDTNIFFLSYLIVSSIQMGANIDYAIVISSRYSELKREMTPKEAIVETLNQAFPTIITSGLILSVAGLLIGFMSSDVAISAVGECLGRGTLISIGLVMCVLPQIMLMGDTIIEKTSFTIKKIDRIQHGAGFIRVNGRVRGYISGIVDAEISGVIRGEVSAQLDSADAAALRERVDKRIAGSFGTEDKDEETEDF